MFKKMFAVAFATGAAVAAAVVYKVVTDKAARDNEPEEKDDQVHFISIDDEEEEESTAVSENLDQIMEIAALYPNLDMKFVAEQFARNEAFNTQYPTDTLIEITHKAKFDDPKTLEGFAKICADNGYTFEKLSDTEGTVTHSFFTEDGAILSDIYNIANQTNYLKGIYEGYNIEA